MTKDKTVTKIISEIMEDEDISQGELARICDMPQPSIFAVLKKNQELKINMASRLFDALGYDLEISIIKRSTGKKWVV